MSASTLTFPVYALAGVAQFMADKHVRYYLNGLMVEPTRMVATDGHAMAVAHSGGMVWSGPPQRVILPAAMVKDIIRQSRRGGQVLLTIPEDGPLSAVLEEVKQGSAGTVYGDRIDGLKGSHPHDHRREHRAHADRLLQIEQRTDGQDDDLLARPEKLEDSRHDSGPPIGRRLPSEHGPVELRPPATDIREHAHRARRIRRPIHGSGELL